MWIIPRPHYSLSQLWKVLEDNELFQLLKVVPNDSWIGKLANLAVQASDSNPLIYRIVYKSKPYQILAVSNNLNIITSHWNWLGDEIIPKIVDCDWDIRDKYIIPKITGMASLNEEVEEDQNDEESLLEFKTQFNINEKLITYFTCSLWKSSIKPPSGKMYITQEKICYYTPQPTYRLLIPFHRITSINKETSLGFLPSSIKITACVGPDDKTETKFLFHFILRDQAYDMLEQLWKYSMELLAYENELERDFQLLEEQQSPNTSNLSNNNNSNSNNNSPINSPNFQNLLNSSPNLKSKTKNTLMIEKVNRNYQKVFKLPNNEELLQVHSGWINRDGTQIFGEVYISSSYICCKYKDFVTAKKFVTVFHMSQIQSIEKTKPFLGFSLFTDSILIKTKPNIINSNDNNSNTTTTNNINNNNNNNNSDDVSSHYPKPNKNNNSREFLFRLFHCDEALKTMKTYWNINAKHNSNLKLYSIGVGYYEQVYESIGRKKTNEDERNDKFRYEKWLKYFTKKGWDSTMSMTKGLRLLVHMGIPDTLRGHLWSFCSGAAYQWERDSNYYENILKENEGIQTIAVEEIEKDVRRTFAHLPYFKEGTGVDALRRVLVAYSFRHPVIGYCQGMNIVAGNMLLYMKEEAAFWVLSKVCEEYLQDYYVKEMIGSIVDQAIFTDLVKHYLPEIFQHLNKIGLPVNILSLPWFMCLFISYIPMEVSSRVVDCFFLEGTTVLFQTGLAILKINKTKILKERDSEVVVELLRTNQYSIDELIQVTFQDFELSDSEINELRNSHKFKEIKKKQISIK